MSVKTCGDCGHWEPIVPPTTGVMELGKPKRGECRRHPPQVTVVIAPSGEVVGQVSQFPNLPQNFVTCGEFVAVEDLRFKLATTEGG